MAVTVTWSDSTETIVVQTYTGHPSLDDYYHATDEVFRLVRSKSYMVHSILDRSQALSTPKNILSVIRYANKYMPDNLGIRVIVKPSAFSKFVVDFGQRIAPQFVQSVYFATSISEAVALIQSRSTQTV